MGRSSRDWQLAVCGMLLEAVDRSVCLGAVTSPSGCVDSYKDLPTPGCRGSGLYGRPEAQASRAQEMPGDLVSWLQDVAGCLIL